MTFRMLHEGVREGEWRTTIVAEADSEGGLETMLVTLWNDGERGEFTLVAVDAEGDEQEFATCVLGGGRVPIDVRAIGGE